MTKPQEAEELAGLPDGERGVTVWTDPRRGVVKRVDGVSWQGENADPTVSASVERSGSPAAHPSSGPLDVERLARAIKATGLDVVFAIGRDNEAFYSSEDAAEDFAAEYVRLTAVKDPRITADQALANLSEWAKAGISIGDSGESVPAEKPDTTSTGGFPFGAFPQPADTGSQMPERSISEKEAYEQGMLDQAERDAEEWYGPDHE